MMPVLAWAWVFTLPGLVLTALGIPGQRKHAGYASLAGPVVLLIVAVVGLLQGGSYTVVFPNWLPFLPDGAYEALADTLSALMLTILGFVATLVYIYSLGYMADDPSRRRFFVFLDLFVATMGLLVLAGNLAVLLIGWTGVGISSFLLISFWRDKPGTLGAGLQALAANAVGDGALLLAASTVPNGCGTLVTLSTPQCTTGLGGAEFVALLLFVAAAAKSAQGPLYFWLPNAMAGPTPISALIHAATMVAAGVYLLVRTYALLALAPQVSLWIAIVGVATVIGASLAALFQSNFKKGIAFSTVAQLGYMFAAAGVGASFAGLFHLFTHASFKALLFLAAGVVIHGAAGHEELSDLRGLGRFFPFSRWGFVIGSFALFGTPLVTAGSFSKDDVVESVIAAQPVLGWLLVLSVMLTGAYIGRLFAIVYLARARDSHAVHHDASAERPMNWSLVPLMIGSIVLGWAGYWLAPALAGPLGSVQTPPPPITPVGLLAFGLGLIGFVAAAWYVLRPQVVLPVTMTSYRPDRWVRSIAAGGYVVAGGVSRVQTGLLAMYAFGTLLAIAVILLIRVSLVR
ncbi:MAG: NADH-quinone oxidoreductase subunit L [Chloroflexi bacterium]|nr:NADH-quinone oxidoreductase subunit L [Chloroflexota bacterium]MBV9598669.1 NADH-quinone oxidoreductase subunit L [Chloroflexota bacterium]